MVVVDIENEGTTANPSSWGLDAPADDEHAEDEQIEAALSAHPKRVRARARSIMERKTSVSMKDVNEAIARASTAAPEEAEAETAYSPSMVTRQGSISRREVVRAGSSKLK